ncbi:hypothetical protein UlMin_021955 [Ulmus minor]
MTALHVAASEGHSDFVEEIVKLMQAEALEMRDKAVPQPSTITPGLTNILNKDGCTPLLTILNLGSEHKDMAWYLSMVTKDEEPTRPFTSSQGADIAAFLSAIGLNDNLLYLMERYPDLATATTRFGFCFLYSMASVPSNFFSGSKLGFWECWIYELPRFLLRLQNAKLQHQCAEELVERFVRKVCSDNGSLLLNQFQERTILRTAATFGIIEIVKPFLLSCPELAYGGLGNEHNLLSVAIEHRQEKIFNLFCEKNFQNTHSFIRITKSGTLLHLAAKLAPFHQLSSMSGAALQMQRELQWFEAVEKLIQPAREIFTKEHKALAEAGEKWMKDTSNSCMIVSTLIATFVFAAAFTVPGGNDDDGNPIFLWTKSFLVFAIADALALFSSITSLLMFFSILTARYAEEDFLKRLPKKLIFGLAALFFSIATMMMAFVATLYIVLSKRLNWVFIPIILLASLPVTIFALLQFPLFIRMFRSTFGISIFSPQSPWR